MRLTDKEINDLSVKIAKPTYKFLQKQISRELLKLNKKNNKDDIDIADFIDIVLNVTSSLDANMFVFLQQIVKNKTKKELNYLKLLPIYFARLCSLLKIDSPQQLH